MRFAAPRTHPCSHYNKICIPTLQNTKEEPIDLETIQAATTADTRYPSSPAAATLPRKTYGFVLRLPPQNRAHATFMQPLQCDLHPHVAEHQRGTNWPRSDPSGNHRTHKVPFIAGSSHFTPKNIRFRAPASSPKPAPCNIHAAITMRFSAACAHPCSHCNAICNRAYIVIWCIVVWSIYCCVMYCCVMYCCVMYCYVMCCCVMFCYVMYCCVMYCYVVYCCVMYCCVMYCYVMYCCCVLSLDVFLCDVLLCDVLLCDVYCCVMYCGVMYCCVMYGYVMYCCVTYCYVMYCFCYSSHS